jgi:hypothetical protein
MNLFVDRNSMMTSTAIASNNTRAAEKRTSARNFFHEIADIFMTLHLLLAAEKSENRARARVLKQA